MPNIAAIIAVRMRSERLYGKPLMLIEGKPIVGHLIDILRKIPEINNIVLAISGKKENQIFVDYAKQNNLTYYVDVNHDEEDVLGRLIRTADKIKADHVVRATSEGPIRYHNISKVIQHHLKTKADLTFTEKLPGGTNVELLSVSALKKAYEYDAKYHCAMVSLCMFEHPELFKIEIITPPKKLQRSELDLDVDTEDNLFAIKEIFRNINKDKNGFIKVEDALEFLEKQPHLVKLLTEGRKKAEGRIWQ